MSPLAEQLHDYVDAVDPIDVVSIRARVRARAHRRRVVASLAVAVVIVLGAAGLVAVSPWDRSHGRTVYIGEPKVAPLFGDRSGVVLVFDDRINGVFTVDPDRRIVSRKVIEGQRAGDQPFNLTRIGDQLVLGWGGIWVAPIDGGPSRKISDAVVYVPASDGPHVWTFTYPDNALGYNQPATVALVGLDGRVELSGTIPAGFSWGVGVPGGLAGNDAAGNVAVWDAATSRITKTIGTGQPAASNGSLLAWCSESCRVMHVDDLASRHSTEIRSGTPYEPSTVKFSPDGSHLALADAAEKGGGSITIVDTATGDRQVISDAAPQFPRFGWSNDGATLYFGGYANDAKSSIIGRYRLADDRLAIATIDANGMAGSALAVLNAAEAGAFVATDLGAPSDCPSTNVYDPTRPQRQPLICGFRVDEQPAGSTTTHATASTSITLPSGP